MPNTDQILLMSLLCNVSTDYLIFDDCPEQLNLFFLNDYEYEIISKLIKLLEKKEKDNEK